MQTLCSGSFTTNSSLYIVKRFASICIMSWMFEVCVFAWGEAARKNEMVNHPIRFLKIGFCDKTQIMMAFQASNDLHPRL
jgi:hypothetical protein